MTTNSTNMKTNSTTTNTKRNWKPHSPEALAQIRLKRDARIRAWTPLPQPKNTTMSTNLFVDDVRLQEWTPLE